MPMKIIADIYKIRWDSGERKVTSIVYDKESNTVSASEGGGSILAELDEGTVIGEDQNRYRATDGEKFVRAIPFNFINCSYMRAEVREEA
jgi:hypothetical protein